MPLRSERSHNQWEIEVEGAPDGWERAVPGARRVAPRVVELADLGYNEAEVKAIADQWAIEVPTINPDTGEAATRKAIPADRFPSPYANETAARAANNNALPPDLSLIAKNREGGSDYLYSLLTGYADPATYRNEKGKPLPASARPGQGLHFNPYFPNLNIAMPPPLTAAGQVTYAPGNPAPTVDQMAKDVSAFLVWTAEPNLQSRHKSGWAVLAFLLRRHGPGTRVTIVARIGDLAAEPEYVLEW